LGVIEKNLHEVEVVVAVARSGDLTVKEAEVGRVKRLESLLLNLKAPAEAEAFRAEEAAEGVVVLNQPSRGIVLALH